METQPASKSAIPRRGPQLAPIRTDLPRPVHRSPVLQKPRPQRPRPNEISYSPAGERVPLQPSPVKRQSSKANLRNLFTRTKSVRDLKRQNILAAVGERQEWATESAYTADTPRSPTSTVLSTPTVVASPTIQRVTSGNLSRAPSKKEKKKPVHPATSPWVPPPLFQAYPQAVKHACLATPSLSADSILRIQTARRNSSAREATQDASSQTQLSTDSNTAKKKEDKEKRKHERKMSGSISKALWTKKIFVLATSGCLLQYAGEGNFDRLPEKMMRLGPASAAFASDAIPGKPWVLQISQTSYEDGRVAMDSQRRLLSRFGFHSADSRRSTRSFFMVFTNPDEMNAWLVTLRREIESLGGKKYVPEKESEDEDQSPQVHNRPLLVANDLLRSRSSFRKSSLPEPNQLPGHTPTGRSPVSSIRGQNSYQELAMNNQLTKAMSRRSMPSSDTLSISTATTQKDADTIHEYPEDSRSPTLASSALSPARAQPAVARQRRKAPAVASNQDRRSMYAYSSTQSDRQVKDVEVSTRPLSLIGDVSHRPSPSPSPHPNFSVPSFSKRFTMSQGSSRSQDSLSVRGDESIPPSPKEFQSVARPREGFGEMASGSSVSNAYKRRSLIYESSFIRDPTPSPSSFSGSRTGSLPSSGRYHHGVQSPESPLLPLQSNVPQHDIQPTRNSIRPQPLLRANLKLPRPSNDSTFSGSHQVRFPFMSSTRSQTPSSLRRGSQPEISPSVSINSSYITTTTSTVLSKPSKVLRRANSSTPPTLSSSSSSRGTRLQQQKPTTLSLLTPPPPTQLSERKSMPNLSLMAPPVGPPPDCPLPDVPPDIASLHHPAWRKIPTFS
jgi:hypothetical protein